MQSTLCEMLGWMMHSWNPDYRRYIKNLRYADDITLMAESEEELKSLLMKVKDESEKAALKLNIQKTKIIAPGPITSLQIDGKTMETMTDFISLGSKITADGYCSHEIKRCLLLGRKAMTNLDSLLNCTCAVVWIFFGIAFLWDWNENWPFLVLWPLLSFPNLLTYWVQHFNSISF